MKSGNQIVILVGAGRSGTKIFRDVLASHEEIDATPYDLNYVWKIGNYNISHDALSIQNLKPSIAKAIRTQIQRYSTGAPFLIEKTVSNTLRLPFVLEVFPDAKIIHLVRNGKDVCDSVLRQWGETRGLQYFLSKMRTYPIRHGLSYLFSYGMNWLRFKFFKKGSKAYIWGVKYPGFEKDLKSKSILEVISLQWKTCVTTASEYLAKLDEDRVHYLKYENLVTNPTQELNKISSFLGLSKNEFPLQSNLHPRNVGKGNDLFEKEEAQKAKRIIEPVLSQLNYISS